VRSLSGWHPQGAALGELLPSGATEPSGVTEPSGATERAGATASIACAHPWVASRNAGVPVTH